MELDIYNFIEKYYSLNNNSKIKLTEHQKEFLNLIQYINDNKINAIDLNFRGGKTFIYNIYNNYLKQKNETQTNIKTN